MNVYDLTDEVKILIAKHALCQPEELTSDTRVGEDLRIIGDDADELLADFSTKFNVDLSGMDFHDYFPSEASANMHFYLAEIAVSKYQNSIVLAIRTIEAKFWQLFANNTNYQTLTVDELVKAASSGKWKKSIGSDSIEK